MGREKGRHNVSKVGNAKFFGFVFWFLTHHFFQSHTMVCSHFLCVLVRY